MNDTTADDGRSPSGPGSHASHGAEVFPSSPPSVSIPNAALLEMHNAYEEAMNDQFGVSGWRLLDLPHLSPALFDELLDRIGRRNVKWIAGSNGNFRIASGKAERTENWVRATLLVSPEGMSSLRTAQGGEAGTAETALAGSVHEHPVREADAPNESKQP